MAPKVAAAKTVPVSGPVWIEVRGTIDLGLIDKDAAAVVRCLSGPVRLPEGVGGAKGHGLLHIQGNESRMKQIQGLDYKTATEFVDFIAGKLDKNRGGQ